MCDQPSLYYALYLLVQIFANYDNVPLDLYGLIETEIRKLYYNKEKKSCIKQLKSHIDNTFVRYEKEKRYRVERWGGDGNLSYILPMRYTLRAISEVWTGQQRLEDIITDTTYYINGYRIHPYDWRNDNGAWEDVHKKGYGFDIHSKEDFVALLDDIDSEEYYNDYENSYYVSPHGDYKILTKIIRNQMVLEECKIQMK